MSDPDVLDLLSADHQNLASAEPGSLVPVVMQHLTVERDLLYPAIDEYLSDGDEVLRTLRATDRGLEERLAAFEQDPSPLHENEVRAAIGEHIESRDRLFGQLRDGLPEEVLQDLLDTVSLSIGGSPTHPHPGWPDHGAAGEVAEVIATVADHLRDRFHGHRDEQRPAN